VRICYLDLVFSLLCMLNDWLGRTYLKWPIFVVLDIKP